MTQVHQIPEKCLIDFRPTETQALSDGHKLIGVAVFTGVGIHVIRPVFEEGQGTYPNMYIQIPDEKIDELCAKLQALKE